jgi:regulator of replication initiation timing
MEKDKIFFGESGLTSTSANHIANLAKELYSTAEVALDNMCFYTTTVQLIGSAEKSMLREGMHSVKEIPETMKIVAELKSLIAWLREAIKAKERLIKEAQNGDYEWYGMSIPERPEREEYMTKDDYIATLSIKERNRYYYLEAFCATIGEYIHPNGKFAQERESLKKILSEPNSVSGSGRDTLLYSKKPSLDVQEIEDTFMSLQNTYRSYQAELNSIKYQIEDAVNRDTARKNIDYEEKMSDYRNIMLSLSSQLATKQKEAVDAASNLKIIIPDSLKSIYGKVASLGKD